MLRCCGVAVLWCCGVAVYVYTMACLSTERSGFGEDEEANVMRIPWTVVSVVPPVARRSFLFFFFFFFLLIMLIFGCFHAPHRSLPCRLPVAGTRSGSRHAPLLCSRSDKPLLLHPPPRRFQTR